MGPAAWIPFILRYWRRARVVNQLSKKRLWLLYSARCLHSRAGTREHFYKPSYCLKSLVFITVKIKIVHHSLNILICLFFPGYMPNFQSLGLTRNNLLNLLINRMQFWLHFNVLLPNHINNRFNVEWFISCIDFALCAAVYRCKKRRNCWNLLHHVCYQWVSQLLWPKILISWHLNNNHDDAHAYECFQFIWWGANRFYCFWNL